MDQVDLIQPFCLVASFVNPHDVYVAQYDPTLGYTEDDFHKVTVPLPSNMNEDLERNNKPRAQVGFSWPVVPFENSHQDYVNFYAYLHTVVDNQIMQLLDRLDHLKLTESTLIIRTADHGEQALSHSLLEKFYNAYEESIRIPLVFSNPIAFPQARTTDSLACLLDLVPTLAQLLGVAKDFPGCFMGKDLTPALQNPNSGGNNLLNCCFKTAPEQELVHFTYDDIPSRSGPSIVRCIRSQRYKYAVYFTPNGDDADWEMYNLLEDPEENDNKAGDPAYATIQTELDKQLHEIMVKMKTEPSSFDWPPMKTKFSRGTGRAAENDGDDTSSSSSSYM